jgi:site-specific DNA recombinase
MAGRAIIYVRVSSELQRDNTSPEKQLADCRELCASKGYSIVDELFEVETGMNSYGWRPEWQKALARLRSKEADVLVSWKQDRSARGLVDPLNLWRELKNVGALWDTVKDGEITPDTAGMIQVAARGIGSQLEWENFTARSQAGREARVKVRRQPLFGRCPLFGFNFKIETARGYAPKKVGYLIDPETAPIVVRCYEAAAAGMSLHRLARQLNTEGVPTPTQWLQRRGQMKEGAPVAERWSRQMLRQMLTNPSYKGHHIAYRRENVKTEVDGGAGKPRVSQRFRAEDDAKCVVLTIPAIVEEGLWARAVAEMQQRKLDSPRRNSDPEATLLRAGIAYCGHCGTRMVATRRSRGEWAYLCPHSRAGWSGETPPCPGGAFEVRASQVDKAVWDAAWAVAQDTPRLRRLMESREGSAQQILEAARAEAQAVAENIAEYENSLTLIKKRIATETDDRIYASLREEFKRVDETLIGLKKKQGSSENRLIILDAIFANLDNLRAQYLAGAQNVAVIMEGEPLPPDFGKDGPALLAVFTEHTYMEKRQLLNLLGVKVRLYATDSDYYRAHGKRWEITFNPDGDSDNVQHLALL